MKDDFDNVADYEKALLDEDVSKLSFDELEAQLELTVFAWKCYATTLGRDPFKKKAALIRAEIKSRKV